MASSLLEGVAWCEATLGVTPGPGGEHPLMGTHNRLLRIATPEFPLAYLEIIAINPGAARGQRTPGSCWFDMENEALSARIARLGPQLIHWVARVPDVQTAVAALSTQGIDRGPVLQASRATPEGPLQWQITVRNDGQRLFDGCLPTLIQWGAVHPAARMPDSGVTLQALELCHPEAGALRSACASPPSGPAWRAWPRACKPRAGRSTCTHRTQCHDAPARPGRNRSLRPHRLSPIPGHAPIPLGAAQ